MTRIRGRNDHTLNIGTGSNLFPEELDGAVFSVEGVTDYQLVVTKDAFRDVLSLTVESADDSGDLRERLVRALMTLDAVRKSVNYTKTVALASVEVVPRGTLSRNRPKSVRVIDRRNG
jgi:phenylacetate-coenzyme A ligase PaaK-like adenylate-forming protein